MLLRQREPQRDPLVGPEQAAHDIRAVTFLAAMQQDDVIRQSTGAIEEFADSGEGLLIGQVTITAGDTALQEPGAGTVGLHLGVVIGLQRDAIEVAETVKKVGRHTAKIGGVADAIAETANHEAVRAKVIMSEMDRVASEAVDRRE